MSGKKYIEICRVSGCIKEARLEFHPKLPYVTIPSVTFPIYTYRALVIIPYYMFSLVSTQLALLVRVLSLLCISSTSPLFLLFIGLYIGLDASIGKLF